MTARRFTIQQCLALSCLCVGLLACGSVTAGGEVTSPGFNATWIQGETYEIRWTGLPTSTTTVRIELYDAYQVTLKRTIVATTPNNGLYVWTLPANQATGRFALAVTDVRYPTEHYDAVPIGFVPRCVWYPWQQGFVIASATAGCGTTGTCGQSFRITWQWFLGSEVRIDLYKGGILDRVISPSTPNCGWVDWTVPKDLIPYTAYQVKVTSISFPWQCAYSGGVTFIPASYAPPVGPGSGGSGGSTSNNGNSNNGTSNNGNSNNGSVIRKPAPSASISYPKTANTEFKVSWKASSGATEYHLYQKNLGNSNVKEIYTGPATSCTVSSNGKTVGSQWEYRVEASNAAGNASTDWGPVLKFVK
jgi:hypothetical protein